MGRETPPVTDDPKGPYPVKTLGTETADGFIQHKRVTLGGISFDAPVRVRVRENGRTLLAKQSDDSYVPFPECIDGKPVFALPGGYVMVSHP